MKNEEVIEHGARAKNEIIQRNNLYNNRGYICEDFIGKKMDIAELMDKYHASYSEIEDILDSYHGNGTPYVVSFVPSKVKSQEDYVLEYHMEKPLEEIVEDQDSFEKFIDICRNTFIKMKAEKFRTSKEFADGTGMSHRWVNQMLSHYGIDRKDFV